MTEGNARPSAQSMVSATGLNARDAHPMAQRLVGFLGKLGIYRNRRVGNLAAEKAFAHPFAAQNRMSSIGKL
jgi:hypothetical protein